MSNKNRNFSIDYFRGLVIFSMIVVNTPGSWIHMFPFLKHAEWHGCNFPDLVFPAFIIVIGMSMSLSFNNYNNELSYPLIFKIFRRSLIIFLIGVALNWFPFYNKNIEELRVFGILQRIAITYLISSLIVVFAKFDTIKIILTSSIMFFCYWLVLVAFTENPFSLEMNISKKIDSFLLNDSNLYRGFGIPFDPEGFLGSFSSSTQCLLGYIFGKIIFFKKANSKIMISYSVLMILTGLMLNYLYPINKPLWTGSYVIFTSGIIFLGFFFIDSLSKFNGLGFVKSFLRVFGSNSLMSFVLSILLVKIFITLIRIDNVSFYSYVYNNFFYVFFEPSLGSFIYSIVFTILVWLIMFLLDKKNIHVKI